MRKQTVYCATAWHGVSYPESNLHGFWAMLSDSGKGNGPKAT